MIILTISHFCQGCNLKNGQCREESLEGRRASEKEETSGTHNWLVAMVIALSILFVLLALVPIAVFYWLRMRNEPEEAPEETEETEAPTEDTSVVSSTEITESETTDDGSVLSGDSEESEI